VRRTQRELVRFVLVASIRVIIVINSPANLASDASNDVLNDEAFMHCMNADHAATRAKTCRINLPADNLKNALAKVHLATHIKFDIPTSLESASVSKITNARNWKEVIRAILKSYNTVEFRNNEGTLTKIIVLEKGAAQMFAPNGDLTPAFNFPTPPPPPLTPITVQPKTVQGDSITSPGAP